MKTVVRGGSVVLAACAACASYRMMPLPGAPGAMPVRYERTRFGLFHSVEEDGALDRVFAGADTVLATVAQPERGVFASSDGGATWAFSAAPPLDQVLFRPPRIFARSGSRVLRSGGGGQEWQAVAPGGEELETLAEGPGGTLWAGGRGHLFVSADGGATFRTFSPSLPAKNWRVRGIVATRDALFVSVHGDPAEPRDPRQRFAELLEYTSDEAVAALTLIDAREGGPGAVRWGTPGDGVYVSRDGGASFSRSGLQIDAWIAELEDGLYAVAADPLLQAAGLIRRNPELAMAAERQMRGDRAVGSSLSAALSFPGRESILEGPIAGSPVFQSRDRGASWRRVAGPPLPLVIALRQVVERTSWERPETPQRQQQQRAAARPLPPEGPPGGSEGPRGGGRRGRGPQGGGRRGGAETASAQTMLSFLDPARLLARFNS
ncbi:MAG TPA: sialidase family protein, partial [Myxococcales bacterium]